MNKMVLWITVALSLIFQSVVFAANTSECAQVGRYQYYDGAVPKVFDTQTGKTYVWFPRNDKTGEDPYLFVRDPINAKGVHIKIDFIEKTDAKK